MKLPEDSIIASGPVIIENNKVLLNKDGEDKFWKFPGGEMEDFSASLEETAQREVKEEMGIEIEILAQLKSMVVQKSDGGIVILIHYLAKRIGEIRMGDDTTEWDWHDINNLPDDCAPNIKPVIEEYLKSL